RDASRRGGRVRLKAAVLKTFGDPDSDQDAPTTAENLSTVGGAFLVAVGTSRRLFTDRTRTVAGSRPASIPPPALRVRSCRRTLPSVPIRRNPYSFRRSATSMESHRDG